MNELSRILSRRTELNLDSAQENHQIVMGIHAVALAAKSLSDKVAALNIPNVTPEAQAAINEIKSANRVLLDKTAGIEMDPSLVQPVAPVVPAAPVAPKTPAPPAPSVSNVAPKPETPVTSHTHPASKPVFHAPKIKH